MRKQAFIAVVLVIIGAAVAQKSVTTKSSAAGTQTSKRRDIELPPATKSANAAAARKMPKGEGKDVVIRICGTCHALSVVTKDRKIRDQWIDTIKDMSGKGMKASEDDMLTALDYLDKYYSPKTSTEAPNQ